MNKTHVYMNIKTYEMGFLYGIFTVNKPMRLFKYNNVIKVGKSVMSSLSIQGLHKKYNDVWVLKNIDLHIDNKQFVCFLGPSGCGKSTLLRCIAGLENISNGKIALADKNITPLHPSKRNIAMVFQSYALYPHMTVFNNIAFPLKVRGINKKEIKKQVLHLAHILHLENYLHRKPKHLSGGQRQRVAIGRAIVCNPAVLLLDEPLSNLDASLRVEMRVQLSRMHKELEKTMIFVTHDQVEAMTLADKIVVLKDGGIQQYGTPLELYHQPANVFVAKFIGTHPINTYAAQVTAVDKNTVTVTSAYFDSPITIKTHTEHTDLYGAKVTLAVRPNRLYLDTPLDVMCRAKINLIERLGSQSVLHVNIGDATSIVVAEGTHNVSVNSTIPIYARCENFMLFDQHGVYIDRVLASDTQRVLGQRVLGQRVLDKEAGDA